MVGRDERKHIRYQVSWKVEVSAGTWKDVLTVTTSSVSKGGLFVCTTQPGAELGAEVSVSLALPDENTVNLVGEIVRVVAEDAGKGPPGFALRLSAEKASDLVLLEAMASAYGTPENGEATDREIRARVIAEATVTEESAVKPGPSPTEDGLPEVTPDRTPESHTRSHTRTHAQHRRPGPRCLQQAHAGRCGGRGSRGGADSERRGPRGGGGRPDQHRGLGGGGVPRAHRPDPGRHLRRGAADPAGAARGRAHRQAAAEGGGGGSGRGGSGRGGVAGRSSHGGRRRRASSP